VAAVHLNISALRYQLIYFREVYGRSFAELLVGNAEQFYGFNKSINKIFVKLSCNGFFLCC
jgi:hypothetical protein